MIVLARLRAAPLIALLAAPLAAQRPDVMVDAGVASMRYADSIDASTASISPLVRLSGATGAVVARGTLSRLEGAWTSSGRLDASLVPFSAGKVSGELTGVAGGSSHANGARTGQLLASARVHLGDVTRGGWVGGGLGRTWDGAWREVIQGDAGGWLRAGLSTLLVSVTPTAVDDTIRYVDTFVALHSERQEWELDASIGYRAGDQLPVLPANRSLWGQAGAIFWPTPHLGLAVAAGSYPVDFTQGFPGGRYISVGMRVRAGPRFVLPAIIASPSPEIREFEWTRIEGDLHRIRVQVRDGSNVELLADFTGWQPRALRHDGHGRFSTLIAVPKGTHEVNIRVNGGRWLVPPGTIARTDEFGAVGIMVVR